MTKPITGSWLNLRWQDRRNLYTNRSPEHIIPTDVWELKLEEMRRIGIEYLIFLFVAFDGQAYYESEFLPHAWGEGESPVAAILRAADRLGMKVFLSCGWAENELDDVSDPPVMVAIRRMLAEMASRLAGHRSFHGWYFPSEGRIGPRPTDAFISYVNTLAADARKLTPHAKLLISPYGLFKGEIDDEFARRLAMLDVDIIAYQDEVGCERVPQPIESSRASFSKLREVHDRLKRIALWANVETFTWDGPANRPETPLIPAPFPRILAQMEAVSPNVERIVSFIVQGMMDAPGSPVPLGHPNSAALYRDYQKWLSHGG